VIRFELVYFVEFINVFCFVRLPLMPDKQSFKVPVYVAASLAHRGFDVDDFGKVTWRENAPLHPRNWPALRKLYDVSTHAEYVMFSEALL
jgi:hypothetical protein